MKILFISDVYFPRVNGVSTSIQTFRTDLHALGNTVHLVAPDYLNPSADETDILRVPARRVPFDPEDRFMRYRWVMQHLDRFRKENYDIIHVQTPFVAHYLGIRLSRLMGVDDIDLGSFRLIEQVVNHDEHQADNEPQRYILLQGVQLFSPLILRMMVRHRA